MSVVLISGFNPTPGLIIAGTPTFGPPRVVDSSLNIARSLFCDGIRLQLTEDDNSLPEIFYLSCFIKLTESNIVCILDITQQSAATYTYYVRISANGGIIYVNDVNTGYTSAIDEWNLLSIYYNNDGDIQVRLNNILIYYATASTGAFRTISFGDSGFNSKVYISDLIIRDDTWPNAVEIRTAPIAAQPENAFKDWYSGITGLNDLDSNDFVDDSYNITSVPAGIVSMVTNSADEVGVSGDILAIAAVAIGSCESEQKIIQPCIRLNNESFFYGGAVSYLNVFNERKVYSILETNPITSGAWINSEISSGNNMQIGYQFLSSNPSISGFIDFGALEIASQQEFPLQINTNNTTLYIQNSSAVSGIDLYTYGNIKDSGNIPLYIEASHQSSDLTLYTTGHTISSGNIDLYINGFAKSSGDCTLYIDGLVRDSGNIPLFTWGYVRDSGDITLFTGGKVGNSGDTTLYLSGWSTHSGDSTLYITGGTTTINNCTLFMAGHTAYSGNTTLFINGAPNSGICPLFIWGNAGISGDSTLFITGDISFSGDTTLYMYGYARDSGTMPLYLQVHDPLPINSGVNLFTWSTTNSGVYSSRDLFLQAEAESGEPAGSMNIYMGGQGTFSSTSNMNLFLKREAYVANATTTLYLHNQYTGVSSGIPLYMSAPSGTEGAVPHSGTMNLFINRPFESVAHNMSLFVNAPVSSSNAITLYSNGQQPTGVMPMYIFGIGATEANPRLFIKGF